MQTLFKYTLQIVLPVALVSTLNLQLSTTFAQGTAFTYQGQLADGGAPVDGYYDLTFSIWNNATGPAQVGITLTNPGTRIGNGLFSVTLDFGYNIFSGEPRWVEIGVRTNGLDHFTPLSPRQRLQPTPYAMHAEFAGNIEPGANVSFSGPVTFGYGAGQPFYLAPGLTNHVMNLNADYIDGYDSSSFWLLGGNQGQLPSSYVLGTLDNNPLDFKVNAGRALRLEPTLGIPNVIGGAAANTAGPTIEAATIAGGGLSAYPNRVTASYATIGGGTFNNASNAWATVAGGRDNAAGGVHATVGGGYANVASGFAATVPGGELSLAAGGHSFAAGFGAMANHDGAFVWSDATGAGFASTAPNQFLIRASGGVGINTNAPSGAALAVQGPVSFASLGTAVTNAITGVLVNQGGSNFVLVADARALAGFAANACGTVNNGPSCSSPELIGVIGWGGSTSRSAALPAGGSSEHWYKATWSNSGTSYLPHVYLSAGGAYYTIDVFYDCTGSALAVGTQNWQGNSASLPYGTPAYIRVRPYTANPTCQTFTVVLSNG